LIVDTQDPAITSFTNSGLTNGQEYCYKVSSYYDAACESGYSEPVCATPQNQGQTTDPAAVTSLVTGYYSGKGSNKTWTPSGSFTAGDEVVVRALVVDATGSSIANATVEITIGGPEAVTLNSNPSNGEGWAEASWQTQKPSKKGQGGTTPGSYTASVTNITATGYHWDGVITDTSFTMQ
jgi:hypothetical protein